jgi:hypothetical protein
LDQSGINELWLGILSVIYPSSILDYLEQQLLIGMYVHPSAIGCILAILSKKLAEDVVDK